MRSKFSTKVKGQSLKIVTAAAIILMSCTLVTAATSNDVAKTDPGSNISTTHWADFLPVDSLTLMPARKITLSLEWALSDAARVSNHENPASIEAFAGAAAETSATGTALKIQEIAYPTVYTGPRTSHAKFENAVFNVNLAYMAALNVADYFTTREALKYEELVEANPIMRPFVGNDLAFAAVKAGLAAGSYFLLKGLYKKNRPLAWAASLVANVALSYVVVNNLRMIDSVQPQPGSISR